MSQEFAWPIAKITGAFALSVLSVPVVLSVCGFLVDRFGARSVVLPAIVVYGLSTLAFGFVGASLWQIGLLFLLSGIGGLAATMPLLKTVSATFGNRRGLALAALIGGAGALSGAIAAPGVQAVIAQWGWRTAFLVLAGFILLVALPILHVLLPGETSGRQAPTNAETETGANDGSTLSEGLRSRAFWLVTLALAFNAFVVMAFRQHIVFIFGEQKLPADISAYATSVLLLASILGQFGAGLVADRSRRPIASLPFFLFPAAGLILVLFADDIPSIALTGAFLLGLGSGGENCLSPILTARYFGLRSFGRLQGIKLAIMTFATGLSATATALLVSAGWSYAELGRAALFLLALGAVAVLGLPPYPSPQTVKIAR